MLFRSNFKYDKENIFVSSEKFHEYQDQYTVTIRPPVPDDLSKRITGALAQAMVQAQKSSDHGSFTTEAANAPEETSCKETPNAHPFYPTV